jgi:Pyridine nucleotide-disulphide oxidoreductase
VISVIGAGPAGPAVAVLLRQSGQQVVVLERDEVGAAWETRYDRLHLYTVRWLSSLPGYPIPRSFGKWPARDRVVEYLHAYAERNHLDVRAGVAVERIDREGDGWVVRSPSEVVDGSVVHSKPYLGKRVLVAGSGTRGRRSPSTSRRRGPGGVARRSDPTERRPPGHARRAEPAARDRDGAPAGRSGRPDRLDDAPCGDSRPRPVRPARTLAPVLGLPAARCAPDPRRRARGRGPEGPRARRRCGRGVRRRSRGASRAGTRSRSTQ